MMEAQNGIQENNMNEKFQEVEINAVVLLPRMWEEASIKLRSL